MIEELSCKTFSTNLCAFLCFGHRRVSALRNECIERGNTAFREKFICNGEKNVRVIVAGFIRDDCENPFTGLDHIEGCVDDLSES